MLDKRLNHAVRSLEIARLENSLEHLASTQAQLEEAIQDEVQPDPTLLEALQDNRVVMSVGFSSPSILN